MDHIEFAEESDAPFPTPVLTPPSERSRNEFGFVELDQKNRVFTSWDSNQYIEEIQSGSSPESEDNEGFAFESEISCIDSDSRDIRRLDNDKEETGTFGLRQFSWTESDIFEKNGELSTVYQSLLKNAVEAARKEDQGKNLTFAQKLNSLHAPLSQNAHPNSQAKKREAEVHLVLDEALHDSYPRQQYTSSRNGLLSLHPRELSTTNMKNYFCLPSLKPRRERSVSPQPNFFFKPATPPRQYLSLLKEKLSAPRVEASTLHEPKTQRPSRSVLTRTQTSSSEHLSHSLIRSNKKKKLNNPLVTEFQRTIKPKHVIQSLSRVKQKLFIKEQKDPSPSFSRRQQSRVVTKSPFPSVRDRSYEDKFSKVEAVPISFSIYLSHQTVEGLRRP